MSYVKWIDLYYINALDPDTGLLDPQDFGFLDPDPQKFAEPNPRGKIST